MLTIIAFLSLIVAVISFIFAIQGRHRLYWLTALAMYIFSFLAGFSIGLFTVVLAFVFLSLAIGYSLEQIKKKVDYSIYSGIGLAVGIGLVVFAGSWVFFPFWKLVPSSLLG